MDDLLGEVIRGLYGPSGGLVEYDFALIDADLLGRVYEQYLGHMYRIVQERHRQLQLRLERGFSPDRALSETVELIERRQSRKAMGIYYTPKWVVDYIVKQTVGRFIEEHKGRTDAIHEMTILDPACGSGSFLIRAYDELLEWHRDIRPLEWVFSDERLRILRKNIYGVDLDQQAVEIARLNLLLRTLRERQRLPELATNIKRGNSLISGEPESLNSWFGDAWEEKHSLDWDKAFPGVMDDEGFDVVIGNPPYVRIQNLPRDEADYFRDRYESAFGAFDIYVMFLEKGLQLLKPGGRLGFITSGKFLKAEYGKKLQTLFRREATVETIVDLSAHQVFAEATTYPVMIVLRKGASKGKLGYISVGATEAPTQNGQMETRKPVMVRQESLTEGIWPPLVGEEARLKEKLESSSDRLGKLSQNVFQGLITSADNVYHLTKRGNSSDELVSVYSKAIDKEFLIERAVIRALLSGKHVRRYHIAPSDQMLLFPYTVSDGIAELISVSEFESRYPRVWAYLQENREVLENREHGKMRNEKWYAFGRTQNLRLHDFRKFAIPRLVHHLHAFYDREGLYYLDNVDVGGLILKDEIAETCEYVLGLINSSVLNWYFRGRSAPFRGGFRSANRQFLEPLPIRRVDFSDRTEKEMHGAIVGKVERMLELQERMGPVRNIPSSERDDLQKQIEQVDNEIDDLVYDLYGLTRAERKVVEESVGRVKGKEVKR